MWVQQWGGFQGVGTTFYGFGHNLRCDELGNIIVGVPYYGNGDLDPGPGVNPVSGQGIYLSKFDSWGDYQWGVSWPNLIWCPGLAVHSSGRIIMGGDFFETMDFDPGPGVDMRTPQGDKDACFIAMSAGGDYQAAVTLGNTGPDWIGDAGYDPDDNLFLAGGFNNTVDFDPGSGECWKTAKSKDASFLMKMNSNGSFAWVQAWGVSGPGFVETSPNGRAYVAGDFAGLSDFYPGSDTEYHDSDGDSDFFIMMFPPDGNW